MTKTERAPKRDGVNLTGVIPQWAIWEDGIVLNHNSGAEAGLMLWLPESSGTTDEGLDRLAETYRKIIESFPVQRGRLRFMVENRAARESEVMTLDFAPTDDPVARALINGQERVSRERFEGGEYKVHNVYVFVHIPEFRRGVDRSSNRQWSDAEAAELISRCNRERQKIADMLKVVGVDSSPILQQDAFAIMYSWLNFGALTDEVPEFNAYQELPADVTLAEYRKNPAIKVNTLRAQLTDDILTDRYEFLRQKDAYVLVSDMQHYGKDVGAGMADHQLLEFTGTDYWYVVDIYFEPEAAIMARVNRNVNATGIIANDTRSPQARAEMARADQELHEAYYAGNRFVTFSASFVAVCRSEAELRHVRSKFKNRWTTLNESIWSGGLHDNFEQFTQRLAPYGGGRSRYQLAQQANDVVTFLPFFGPWLNRGGETLAHFENEYGTQQRITLPHSSENAAHLAFVGRTGSGKSFALMYLMMLQYMAGATIRLTDFKKDYVPFVNFVGGQFVPFYLGATLPAGTRGPNGEVFQEETPVCYNVFEARDEALDQNDVKNIRSFLMALLAERLSSTEKSIFASALDGYLSVLHETDASGNQRFIGGSIGDFAMRLLRVDRIGSIGLDQNPETKNTARDLAIKLQYFTTGLYGQLFNGRSTISFKNRVIAFDLSQIQNDDNLTGAVTALINTAVWDEARNRTDRTSPIYFLSEESGVLGKINEVVDTLDTISMVGRAYNLRLIVVAQKLASLNALKTVMSNCTRVIFGALNETEAAEAGQMFDMNESQVHTLARLSGLDGVYREYYMREVKPGGNEYGKFRYRPTDLEYVLFSSTPEDTTRRDRAIREHAGDMESALTQMISERRAVVSALGRL